MRISKKVTRWFKVEQDDDGAELLIKHLYQSQIMQIAGAVTSQKMEYKDNEELVAVHDQKIGQLSELMILDSVKGWKNMFDEDGNELVYNRKNVKRAIAEIQGFTEVVNELREKLKQDIEGEKEVQEKN